MVRCLVLLLLGWLGIAGAAAQTSLSPPSVAWGAGNNQTPVPVQIVGYDSVSGLPCIVGSAATCLVSTAGGVGGSAEPGAAALTVDWPATIAGSATWTSIAIATTPPGRSLFVVATSSQAGTLSIQRYADAAATIAIGAAISQALSADVSGTVAVNDGLPYLAAKISIVNGSGSTATISGTAAGQGAV